MDLQLQPAAWDSGGIRLDTRTFTVSFQVTVSCAKLQRKRGAYAMGRDVARHFAASHLQLHRAAWSYQNVTPLQKRDALTHLGNTPRQVSACLLLTEDIQTDGRKGCQTG